MLRTLGITFLALTFALVSAATTRAQDLLWAKSAGGTSQYRDVGRGIQA